MTIWIDASAGASGDMLLGALVGAGVPLDVLQTAVDTVAPEPVTLAPITVQRNGFAAVLCGVRIEDSVEHRSWRDIRALLQVDRSLRGRPWTRDPRLRTAGRCRGHGPRE